MSNKFPAIASAIVGGFIVWGYYQATGHKAEPAATNQALSQRKQTVQDTIKAGSQTTEWQTPQGTIIELNIPRPAMGGTFVENKHCIVWRDTVTKTAAISCDKEEIDLKHFAPEKPDIQ